MIGDGRKTVRHALRNDNDVASLNLTARESHHGPAAGWAVQDRRHFVVGRRSRAIDDRSAGNERPAARNDDISLSRVVMVDAVRPLRTLARLAACGLWIR